MIFKGTFSRRMDWVGADPHKRSRIPPPNFPSSLLWNGAFLFSLAYRIKIKHGWALVEGLCSTDSNSTSNNFSWKIWPRRITTWEKIWSLVFFCFVFFLPKSFTWTVVLLTKATRRSKRSVRSHVCCNRNVLVPSAQSIQHISPPYPKWLDFKLMLIAKKEKVVFTKACSNKINVLIKHAAHLIYC